MKINDNSNAPNSERKKAIKQLYFLAEELKAYTDLTGDRFDIDNAQRRLWPFQGVLRKDDFPDVQKLYDTLSELLEVSSFFDKLSFSKSVDELYILINSMNE